MGLSLDSEVMYVKGVGPKLAKAYAKLGIFTVKDLIYHLPRRYEDRTHLPSIQNLKPNQFATIKGRLVRAQIRPTRGGTKIVQATVSDGTAFLTLSWFNQPWLLSKLEEYKGEIIAYGLVKEGYSGLEINGPEWETLGPEDDPTEFTRIVPIYPLTEGLLQKQVRKGIKMAIESCCDQIQDPLSLNILKQENLNTLSWALYHIHWPESETSRQKARARIVFDEFLRVQLNVQYHRFKNQALSGIEIPIEVDLYPSLEAHLPFELTGAQKRVLKEIWSDMGRPVPMNRLVQGDVGSGKTIVAACAMYPAIKAGYQTCLMAPTEILAEQHYYNLKKFFEPFNINVQFLVGKLRAKPKRIVLDHLRLGIAQVCVGTHALIQEDVVFHNLGFAVIDEQHRFGVLQRAALREKAKEHPDILVMTATPIPRTLTMTLYGDLDLSVIDELPPGRKPIKTHWKLGFERPQVYETVRKLLDQGRQAYFVCPMIEESEKLQAKAAEELYQILSEEFFRDYKLGLLHGQMRPDDKELVMERFRAGELHILVSTVVIEVGVDVPNATVMVVEDAYRFGLSQLHQLRGRVGRGEHQSYCILVSDAKTDDAQERMNILVQTSDGFKIAEADLKLRGPGEIAGTKQSGNLDFKLADLVQDSHMLETARQAALKILNEDPTLSKHPYLKEWALQGNTEKFLISTS